MALKIKRKKGWLWSFFKHYDKFQRIVFCVLVIVFAVNFVSQNNYKNAHKGVIDDRVLSIPSQEPVQDKTSHIFSEEDFSFYMEPQAEYTISGLVTKRHIYPRVGTQKEEHPYFADVCLLYGPPLRKNLHIKDSIDFYYANKLCQTEVDSSYKGGFHHQYYTTNRLIITDKELQKKIKSLHGGDQVQIEGQLVDVYVGSREDPIDVLTSSLVRDDRVKKSPEIIWVQDVIVLNRANPDEIFYVRFATIGFAIMALIWLARTIFGLKHQRRYYGVDDLEVM